MTDFAVFKLIKRTNLDLEEAACLHVVHFLQHPALQPTSRSTQDSLFNAAKKKLWPLLAGNYATLTKQSTR
jgi:hypothetical protein